MTPIVRFAPSPTGNIHIGNSRTALVNWLYAKKHNGQFILRYDDTDKARSKQEYADQILKDLNWLGIEPDRIERQSGRFSAYDEAAEDLRTHGLLYACYETPDELDRKRKRQLARGLPPIYDRTGLNLTAEQKQALEAEGRNAHWRFLLPNFDGSTENLVRTPVTWNDVVRGEQTIDLASMSDPVLIREDGTYLYTLPSVVDDVEMGVTHIIRGDDHVTNTAAQIAIFEALGAKSPDFGHHNLLTTASGEGLSKRLGSLSIASLNEDGYEPMAVASLAVLIGTSAAVEAITTMEELIQRFDPSTITKSAAKFDVAELDSLNKKLVHAKPYSSARQKLEAAGIGGGEDFWNVVRENIEKLPEAADWWQMVEHATPVIEKDDVEFLQQARTLLPDQPWGEETWTEWTSVIKQQTGRKGRGLFMPLRKAMTGREHGPELAAILLLIGREKALARLAGVKPQH
ncbi:MAG: glutamate--tRNA ligase [Gammaproteobacteria bacterium]|nr:glutamate--tRNA ligase [Gammaproteobacteria bacterium]